MSAAALRKFARPLRQSLQPRQYKEFYVQQALRNRDNRVYLEIGVRDGQCFRKITADKKYAVDPVRTKRMMNLKAEEEFFEYSSDDFFEGVAPTLFADTRVSVCMVDGLHTYDQALRDVLNASQWMHPDGAIVMDDCFPANEERASSTPTGESWNGDVWKAVALLKKTQPQWSIETFDVDEGVGFITGFREPYRYISQSEITLHSTMPFSTLKENSDLIGLKRV